MGEHSAWRVPGYVVESLLGAGGSGTVWRGRSRRTAEQVALKHLPIASVTALAEARSEAALLSALAHPHLIGLREVVFLDQALVLVLDLAPRGSLAELLAGRGRLTVGETITAVAPVAAAVAYAHANGVVHGDISPANIVFSERGDGLLTDLGLARLTGSIRPGGGTPGYTDPAAGVVPLESGDVFSLGAVAFHALTGGVPRGEVRASLAAVPEAVADVVARAVDPDPARRGTAADFALDLRHAASPTAVEFSAGREPGPARPAPTRAVLLPARPPARRRRSRRWLWALAPLALLALLAFRPRNHPAVTPGVRTAPEVLASSGQAQSPASLLAELDQVRQTAYATRDADLLARVYVPGALLDRDRAQLAAEVPLGCAMTDVHTTYADLAVTAQTDGRLQLRTTAVLQPATLICGGSKQGTAAGTSAGLQITMIHSPGGWKIAQIS